MQWSIYLAGPDVFFNDNSGQRKKDRCIEHGLEPLYPLDNEIKGNDVAYKIFRENLAMIDRADAVLANITPFRGPSCDPGTALEIGYALRAGKRIYCYSSDERDLKQRIQDDYPDYLNDGMTIEDFALLDNLMIGSASSCICVDARHDKSAYAAFVSALDTVSADMSVLRK